MNPKEEAVLDLIKKDKSFENYFFRTKKNVKWFYELKKRGYFDPKNNPSAQPADREGYFVIPQWNVLEYLEKVAQQVCEPENEQYVDELLEIIKNVSNYRDQNEKVIDNYRTWWFFIKILLLLPNSRISEEVLDFVPTWLNSRFGQSLVDADTAGKLLPKFLAEQASTDDIKKAERLIDHLTNYIWVKKKGMLVDEEKEPEGVVEDHWLIESFLEKERAKLAGRICGENVIYLLARKVKGILAKRDKSNWIETEDKGTVYRFAVALTDEKNYSCIFGQYQKSEKKEDLLETYKVKLENSTHFEIDAGTSNDFSTKIRPLIEASTLPTTVKDKFKEGLKGLYEYLYHDYSYIYMKSLYPINKSKLYNFREILMAILAESFYEKVNSGNEVGEELIKKFLSEEYRFQMFKRLSLIAIGNHWENYKDLFWNNIVPNEEPVFEDPAFENELRYLLTNNATKFSEEEKKLLDQIIETGPQKNLIEENKDKYILYWKQRWYRALQGDLYFAEKYQAIKKISSYDEKQDEIYENEEFTWIGPGESSLTEEDILKMNNSDLAARLASFKESSEFGRGPSAEGLANALQRAIAKQPDKFVKDLTPFINTGFFYICHMLDGFKDAWKSRVTFEWGKLLEFVRKYINRPEFWRNKLKVKSGFYDADNKWVVGSIGELIEEGTRDDSWSIPQSNLPAIKIVYSFIVENVSKDERKYKSFPNHVLNCGLGKIVTSLIYVTLSIARFRKQADSLWDSELKTIFERFLDRDIYDAYTVLGEYLINFAYLDKTWTANWIKSIEKIKDKVQWEAFMSGYLTAGRVNLDLYNLMKKHYARALSHDFEEQILNERLVDHIGIGYLNGHETIDNDGLLTILWKKWDVKRLQDLISYLVSQRKELIKTTNEPEINTQMRNRIIDFWRKLYENYKTRENLTKSDKELLSDVIRLTVYLEEINDENFKWLMQAVPYVQERYHSPQFLEDLNYLKDKGDKVQVASRIGQLFIEMMKSYKPDYDESDIRSIIEHLYQVRDPEVKKLTDKTCNDYARAGMDLVTNLYTKYNP